MKNLFLFLIAISVLFPVAAPAWQAKVVAPTRKVTVVPSLEIAVTEYDQAVIEGCRNEWESFQIVIRPDTSLSGVNVVVSDLTDNGGNVIPAKACRLYREWFLSIENPSGFGIEVPNHERRAGLYPDPLIPFFDPWAESDVPVGAPFDVPASDHDGEPGLAVVWVDLRIPADAVPGVYRGTATVSAQDEDDIVIPISVSVWEIDMPDERNVGTSFRMSDSEVRRYHGGPDAQATSENFSEILRRYYVAGQEHRMDPTGFTGPVDFQFDDDGNLLDVDWTAYDEYMEPRIDGSYFGTGIGVARFDVGMFGPGRGRSLDDEQYKKASAELARHLDEKGWWHKAWVYSKDEPWLADIGEDPLPTMQAVANDAALLIQGSQLWKGHILVTGPMFDLAAPYVGIWCPVQPMYDSWYWTTEDYPARGDYDEHLANGGTLWFYNCNGNVPPYPGYDIDTSIGYEPRILKWGSWWEGATGYLFWRQLYWGRFDPWVEWQSIDHFGVFFARNGDGLLMYPGDADGTFAEAQTPDFLSLNGPVVSFRMKQIRDGFEDWELFLLAEKAGIGEWTRAEVSKVYSRFGNFMEPDCEKENYYCPDDEPWTLDETALLEVRRRVAAKLLFTLYPDRYADPDAPVEPETVEEPTMAEVAEPTVLVEEFDVIRDVAEPEPDNGSTDDKGGETAPAASGGCSSTGAGNGLTETILMILALVAVTLSTRKKTVFYKNNEYL